MNRQTASGMDQRKIVVEILLRLHKDGCIDDGQLLKKDLMRETQRFIRRHKITNFTYDDMPKVLLKYDFCYYMKPQLAHKSKFFNINMAEIERLVENYSQDESAEESGDDSSEASGEGTKENAEASDSYNLQYILTTEQKNKKNFGFSDKSCFICQETFNAQKKFEDHMKGHGKVFKVSTTNWYKQMMNVTTSFRAKEGKFVCMIESNSKKRATFEVNRIFLVFPGDNEFHPLNIYQEDNMTMFDIQCEVLSTVDHPYSILIFYSLECEIPLITQFHFTIKKLFHHEDITLEQIKEKNLSNLPQNIRTMKFETLNWYPPSKEMKSLTEKSFTSTNLTPDEKRLQIKVNSFLNTGVTQENYVQFWETIIQIEDCTTTELLAKTDRLDEKLIWSQGYYLLEIPNLSEHTPAIMEGDKVTVAPSEKPAKKMFARVHQVKKDHIVLDVEANDKLKEDTLFDVHFLPNRMTIQLEREALTYVKMHRISKFFFPNTIPTHSIDFEGFEWINESVKSNPEQQIAIMHIVGKSSFPVPYILMGPPGTGKTTTIVEAVCQIIKRDPEARILVAAGSNYAANVIALRLLRFLPETSVYRMFASSKEAEADTMNDQLKKISNLKFDSHYYPGLEELYSYNVVLTTLAIAGKFAQAKINRKHFSYVFIDEAGSSTEPSTLIPIAGVISSPRQIHGQIILAGDPMQLGPIVASDMARDSLGVSLLERLIDTGIYNKDPMTGKYNPRVITKLIRNFRSHPKILEFSDEEFYSGELMAEGRPEITRWACNWRYLPNRSIPIIFEHVIGNSAQDDNSPSWYNMLEVRRVMFHIDHLIRAKNINGKRITQDCIGVISPYKKQCQKIAIECKKRNLMDIEVGSVEKFQGHEKPVIILSTVRSLTRSVGFLNNPKRLNVALTRAQALLIIVGNVDTLERDETWGGLIAFCRSNNLIKDVISANQDATPQRRNRSQSANRKIQPKVAQPKVVQPTKSGNKENVKASPTKTVEPPRTQSVEILNLPDVPKNDTIRQSSVSDISGVDVHSNSTPRETHERPLYPRQPQFAMPMKKPPLDTYSRFEMVNRLHSGGSGGVVLDERCGTGRYSYTQKDLISNCSGPSGSQGLVFVEPRHQDWVGPYVFLEKPLPHLGQTPRPPIIPTAQRSATTFQQNPPKPEKKKEKKCLIM